MNLEQIKKKKEDLDQEVKSFFNEFIKNVFLEFPELVLISWAQYTPYFNDGDPCIFRVHDAKISFNAYSSDDELDTDEYIEHEELFYPVFDNWSIPEEKTKYKKLLTDIDNMLSEVSSYLQDIFGDHAEVLAFKDKIVVTEYDHD